MTKLRTLRTFSRYARRRAQSGQRRVHNAFGGTHATLALFTDAALLRVVAVAGLVLTATAASLLSGCAHPLPVAYTAPSVAPVVTALSSTRGEITTTRQAINRARTIATKLAPVIPAANRADFTELTKALDYAAAHVQAADNAAAVTSTNLSVFDAAVTNQTATLNKTTDRLNYIEPKYQSAVGLIWKWRLYFLGLAGGLITYLLIKHGSRLAVTAAAIAAKVP